MSTSLDHDTHRSVVFDEIGQGPEVAARLLTEGKDSIADLAAQIRNRGIRQIVVAARGTSLHAGLAAKYVWEYALSVPVAIAAPSLYTVYGSGPLLQDDVMVVGISQSGETSDVSRVLADARRTGALTVAITNSPESHLPAVAEHVIELRAGREKSIPATKTYLADLLVVYMLAAALAPNRVSFAALAELPECWNRLMTTSSFIEDQVATYGAVSHGFVLGRGLNYPTALEIALKLKEMCYVQAEGYSTAEFQHGPVVLVEPGYPIVLLVPRGPSLTGNVKLAKLLRERGARLVVISSESEALRLADAAIEVPVVDEEIYSPLHYVIPGFLFAAHLAAVKGLDPDRPRGLVKVAETV